MNIKRNVFAAPNFRALFQVMICGAINDNILKNALLVLLTFVGFSLFGLPSEQMVNLAVLLFVLPYFLFSSYAGKLADSSNKVTIVKIVKLCEVIIMLFVALGLIYHIVWLLLLALFAMGTHSTFFGPIKYSIIPQYLPRESFVIANGYIEMGTFVGILLGQSVGSWFVANGFIKLLVSILLIVSLYGYYTSLKLDDVVPATSKVKFYKNIFKDTWLMYHSVTMDKVIHRNLHAISWFWAFGVIFTTQLPVITLHYFGGDAHVFSLIMILFTFGIGFGSLLCAKLSRGQVIHGYVIFGAIGMSLGYILLLLLHRQVLDASPHCFLFLQSFNGIVVLVTCLFIGLVAGFYSVTCYNELQLISPNVIRSQIISANNILNATYMVGASIISSVLLAFISVWWLLMITAICNLIFAWWFFSSRPKELVPQ